MYRRLPGVLWAGMRYSLLACASAILDMLQCGAGTILEMAAGRHAVSHHPQTQQSRLMWLSVCLVEGR